MLHLALAVILSVCAFGSSFSDPLATRESSNPQALRFQNDCDVHDGGGAWSPDGKSIAFMSSRSGNVDIWVMGADGSNPRNLTSESLSADYLPAWSPDGKQIVYYNTYELGRSNIWLIESDGSNPRNLTSELTQSGYFMNVNPVWSPDGKFIAFASSSVTQADIMVIEIEDFTITNLTENIDAVFIASAWLSDSQHLAFASVDINNLGLWVAARDGTSIDRIVSKNVDAVAGSPTQNVIAFSAGDFPSSREGLDIYLINQDGSSLIDLTQDLVQFENGPAWSPDGNQIAFQAPPASGHVDIWSINVDGSGLTQLTTDDAADVWPVWSPDGSRILFTSDREDKADVWVMNADGSNQTNLTGKSDCGS